MATPSISAVRTTGDPLIDGLLQGSSWTFSGSSHIITYSLHNLAPGSVWSNPEIKAIDSAFAAWEAVANIDFQRMGAPNAHGFETSPADIAIGFTGLGLQAVIEPGAMGLGIFPSAATGNAVLDLLSGIEGSPVTRADYPNPEGDIFIDDFSSSWYPYVGRGDYGYYIALHEIGHALGLKHPHDDLGGRSFESLGIPGLDSVMLTVMSYNHFGYVDSGNPATPMLLDILAIQEIYGANMSYRTGNDTYTLSIDGVLQTIWDAGGVDWFDASGVATDLNLDLSEGGLSVIGDFTATVIAFDVTIEHATGGAGSDEIVGNDVSNTLNGGGGNDSLRGASGNDLLKGGIGNDAVLGEAGSDRLFGEDGDDDLNGGVGNDSLSGSTGVDVLRGGVGNDVLDGGAGADTVGFNAATSRVTVDLDAGTATGEGVDSLFRIENVSGSRYADDIRGTDGDNVIVGNGGNDRLLGLDGNDRLSGAGHQDWLSGDGGNDKLYGGLGHDVLDGGADHDRLWGDDGHDELRGGSGNDVLDGGLHNDRLWGDDGNDRMFGGYNDDELRGGKGNDLLDGGVGNDRLWGDNGSDELIGYVGDDVLIGGAHHDVLMGIDGTDDLRGGSGNDVLDGGADNDILSGDAGADVFVFSDGLDKVMDFASAEDTFLLLQGMFPQLGEGPLAAGNFAANAGGRALDADDYIVYDTTGSKAGVLYYDPDGSGPLDAIRFGIIVGAPSLIHEHFEVI